MEYLGEGASVPRGVRALSRTVPDVSVRAFLAAFDPPHAYWSAPDGTEIAAAGAAARLRARGDDRVGSLRRGADRLFDAVAFEGPAVARPRAFGGLAFHADHRPDPPWTGFPATEFVLPRTTLVRGDGATHLTVAAAGDRGGPSTREGSGRAGDGPDRPGDRAGNGAGRGGDATPSGPAGPAGAPTAATDLGAAIEDATERVRSLPAMSPVGAPPAIARRQHRSGRGAWTDAVRRALDRIDAGELRKVVLATALSVRTERPVDAPALLERLRRTYPDCYRFLLAPEAGANFFGAPPERLVRLRGRRVETEALAGSVPRGETPEADEAHADALREDDRLRREQGLVTEAIREQLEGLADVRVGDRRVRKLATIQHLATPVTADLRADEHVLSIVEALHPTPAVGGLPPAAAMATIRETEPFDRGWYAAPVGWFDADGDGEFAVAIRSAVGGDRRLTLFGGNGIVADADPDAEWEEVQLKFRPVLDELAAGEPAPPAPETRRPDRGEAGVDGDGRATEGGADLDFGVGDPDRTPDATGRRRREDPTDAP